MKQHRVRPLRFAVLALSAALAAGSALADRPDWAGNGKGKKHEDRVEQRGGSSTSRFTDQHRRLIAEYYGGQQAQPGRKCPPGLAKKNNGCLPPGQAKKRYSVGQPLPPGIELVAVPKEIEVRLGPPPSGYRYGILDGDLVKLAIGTALVVDAIDGLVD